ncbi:hypothetical protein MKW98_028963 [Papaver atlanticum]|uniref:Late embryogenesis abundant protein LEA-2 subgroup domain-containing protein n=1 Tax=Papaver atlanticum TaxID=357466 RepID=A0AAD4TLE4_9MAGN|nr:hypothetical protein MKW98_028963 [Papaver atlanticum]
MGDFCLVASCSSCVLIFIGGLICLYVFLAILPYQHMKFHMMDASLTEFYLTNDDILHYNLAVNISVRNSNKIDRISYRSIRSQTYCYGMKLALVSLPSFRQDTKNTTLLHHIIQDFNYDQRDEIYSIYVYLYIRTQLKHVGGGKSEKSNFIAECGLLRLILLGSNNQKGIGGLFKTRRCVYVEIDDSY